MIYSYEIWDKKTPIKGQEPDYWFENNYEFTLGDVILFKDDTGIVRYVESVLTLKSNYNINGTTNEIAEAYIVLLEEEKNRAAQGATTLEEYSKKLFYLERGLANAEYSLMMGGLL